MLSRQADGARASHCPLPSAMRPCTLLVSYLAVGLAFWRPVRHRLGETSPGSPDPAAAFQTAACVPSAALRPPHRMSAAADITCSLMPEAGDPNPRAARLRGPWSRGVLNEGHAVVHCEQSSPHPWILGDILVELDQLMPPAGEHALHPFLASSGLFGGRQHSRIEYFAAPHGVVDDE